MEEGRCEKCGRLENGQVNCVDGFFAFICYKCIDEAKWEQDTWRKVM